MKTIEYYDIIFFISGKDSHNKKVQFVSNLSKIGIALNNVNVSLALDSAFFVNKVASSTYLLTYKHLSVHFTPLLLNLVSEALNHRSSYSSLLQFP